MLNEELRSSCSQNKACTATEIQEKYIQDNE